MKLHNLLQLVLVGEVCPEERRCCAIIKLPKNRNLANYGSWRAITKLSVPGKNMVMLLLDRMYETLVGRMRDGQGDFRGGRSSLEQIFGLRNTIEQLIGLRRQLVVRCTDFKKVIELLYEFSMLKSLRSYRLQNKIIKKIKLPYEGSKMCFRVGGINTDYFYIKNGAQQGDLVSPFLFVVAVDWILRTNFDGEGGTEWIDTNRPPELA